MGCITLKSKKGRKISEPIKELDTCPEESPEKPPLMPIEIFSPQLSRTPSITFFKEDKKIYTVDYQSPKTFLIEYNTSSQVIKKIDLGLHFYNESGFSLIDSKKLMFAGGIDLASHQEIKKVVIVDLVQETFFQAQDLLFPKRKLRLQQGSEYVYAIGGVKELKTRVYNTFTYKQDYSNSFSRYSINSNTWEILPDMPIKVEVPGCYFFQDQIWVTGGCYIHNIPEITSNIQIFHIKNMLWHIAEFKLPEKIFGHLCMPKGNEVFVFGGIKNEDEYNEDCWRILDGKCEKVCKVPKDYDTFFPALPWGGNNEICCFNEDNDLFVLNLQLSIWTVYNIMGNL